VSGLARERCITCSDEAVEAVVVATDGAEAVVRVAGEAERVAIDLVPDAVPGDLLLCHAGIALERLAPPDGTPQVTPSHELPSPPHVGRGAS
jgi:hydrogenase maturation factor